ncbi:MAG: TonB-dependent receptor [Cytophagales bacterium]|nr:TonB-dependent receptor [Cytophagales bacterium]
MGLASLQAQEKYTLSGYVKEKGSGELLPGVTVYVSTISAGTISNLYGFYSITLEEGTYPVSYSFVGYRPKQDTIQLKNDLQLTVELVPDTQLLEEVEIVAEDNRQNLESERIDMSRLEISKKTLEDIPALLGERDVMKVLQLTPGVQSGSEGSSGIYVRGGGPGENLFILDDAVVYNASHLFGFFSVFNGDAIKSTELYKGGFPSRYGGRLSSVVNMTLKDGNKEELKGKIGLGLISSQLLLEGPIWKGKTSFLFSGRRTYIDVFMRPLSQAASQNQFSVGYFFHDFNAKLNHEFSDRDKLYLSFYYGLDSFGFRDGTGGEVQFRGNIDWGNKTSTLRWNHQVGKKSFSNTSFIFTDYGFQIRVRQDSIKSNKSLYDARFSSAIQNYTLKYDFEYFPVPAHSIRMGALATIHHFDPNAFDVSVQGQTLSSLRKNYLSLENALYIEDEWKITQKLHASLGVRLSAWRYKSRNYTKDNKGVEGSIKSLGELAHLRANDRQYWNPEPRLNLSYKLGNYWSLKSSYAVMYQYIHLLTSSGASLPTDLWVSSTNNYGPQRAEQVAGGLAKDFPDAQLTLTWEGYYKRSQDVIAYREGVNIIQSGEQEPDESLALDWEHQVTRGTGRAYGTEFLIKRGSDRFRGWVGYTLSWIYNTFDGIYKLNRGLPFHPRYDRRHDVSVTLTWDVTDTFTLSTVWVYGTGNNFTVSKYRSTLPSHALHVGAEGENQISRFSESNYGGGFGGSTYFLNDGKLNFKGDAYHRMDLGMQWAKYHEVFQRDVKGVFELSAYNVYNRINPFFYNLAQNFHNTGSGVGTSLSLERYGLFPIIPSVTYRLEF